MVINLRKRGQATAAATLIAIIAALIVLYILFIPPSERQKLLEGEDGFSRISGERGNLTLFELEDPRIFYPEEEKKFERTFSNVNLYVREEGTLIKNLDSLYVSKSIFGGLPTVLEFELTDLENTKNILLNFNALEHKGRLVIRINDKEIFNKELTALNINPIQLKDFLQQGANTLTFSVSSPGASFWRKNEYSLEDITITGDFLIREAQESRHTFVVTSAEKESLDSLRLRFFPSCEVNDVGRLKVDLNNENLYSAIPDCGSPGLPIEFSPKKLVTGENVLKFSTTEGRYLIEQIRINSDIRRDDLPTYYFQLTDEEFRLVENGTANVILTIRFTEDEDTKEADIRVNGKLTGFNQKEMYYHKNINNFIEEGNNAVKIEPTDDAIEIVDFEIVLERK